jgi:hypothetical protein
MKFAHFFWFPPQLLLQAPHFFWEKTGIGGSESSQGSDNAVVLDDFFISTKF